MPSACPGSTASLLAIPSVPGPSSFSALHSGGRALSSSFPHTHIYTPSAIFTFITFFSGRCSSFSASHYPYQRLNNTPFPPELALYPVVPLLTHTLNFIVSKTIALFVILPAWFLLLLHFGLGTSFHFLPYNSCRVLCFITVTQHRVVRTTAACRRASFNLQKRSPRLQVVESLLVLKAHSCRALPRYLTLSASSTQLFSHQGISTFYPGHSALINSCTRYRRQWSGQLSMWRQRHRLALWMPNTPTFLPRRISSHL